MGSEAGTCISVMTSRARVGRFGLNLSRPSGRFAKRLQHTP